LVSIRHAPKQRGVVSRHPLSTRVDVHDTREGVRRGGAGRIHTRSNVRVRFPTRQIGERCDPCLWTRGPRLDNLLGTPVLTPVRNPMRPSVQSLSCLAGLALVASMACHRIGGQESPPEFRNGPSDGNIVALILAADNTDLSYARLVPPRARSA